MMPCGSAGSEVAQMNRDRLFTWIEAAVTGFFLSFSALACMVTAFSMKPVDLWLLALYCGISGVVCGFLCSRRLELVMVGLAALGLGYLWQDGLLMQTLESLLYKVSRVYHDAYDWQIIRWSYRDVLDMERTLAPMVYLLGAGICMVTAWAVAKGQPSVVACLPAALPVVSCFVVTDTLPATVWLVLFFTAVVVMLLTSSVRQTDRVQGRRLAAMAVLPVFVAVGILFLAIPRHTYYHKDQAQAIEDLLLGKYTLSQVMDRLAGKPVELENKKVDLASLGAKADNRGRVMEVTTRHSGGTLYLRSSALGRYTGTQWQESNTDLSQLYWPSVPDGGAVRMDEVEIKTQFAHEMLYLPYYPGGLDISNMTRGISNTQKLNEYSITRVFMDQWSVQFEADRTLTESQRLQAEAASRLPESTKKWAVPLAKEIVGNVQDPYYQALYIGEYVKNSARYDKKTGPMGKGYEDFAQWFLEESETGYCVHFATAGAVLLRALGIPARYVSGYMVNTRVGTPTEVLVSDAHAWVEYWLPGFGWTMLECTPPDESQDEIPEQTHAADRPVETQPDMPEITPGLSEDEPVAPEKQAMTGLWKLALILLGLIAIWLQRKLRLTCRIKRRQKGTPNAQALTRWAEAERLSRLLGQQPPEQLRQLAEKAKFSPYTLTDAELMAFDTYLEAGVARLRKKNIFIRLWHRWVLALY